MSIGESGGERNEGFEGRNTAENVVDAAGTGSVIRFAGRASCLCAIIPRREIK
ncbi:hypothetical protein D3C71_1185160 [compost metagenome]